MNLKNMIRFFVLFLFSFNLFSYSAKVIFIDNNFNNLKENNIRKIVYLSSDVAFDIKKDTIFNLYRNVDSVLSEKIGDNNNKGGRSSATTVTDVALLHHPKDKRENKEKKEGALLHPPKDKRENKEKKEAALLHSPKKELKKVCVIQVKVISVVENLIKVVEFEKCLDRKNDNTQILGEFQRSKVGDFIEIETIFDKKSKNNMNKNDISDIITSIYMLGIDDEFNYLLESGIKEEVNKFDDKESEEKMEKKSQKEKLLPKKDKKDKKTKKFKKNKTNDDLRVPNFEKIRL